MPVRSNETEQTSGEPSAPRTMRAVGYRRSLPLTEPESLIDLELRTPKARGRDLLVAVKAVSVNPVDFKMRLRSQPEEGEATVLGWDAAGIVVSVGPDATLFQPGDAVFYAGSIARPGTNAQYHLVDERIVGRKPATLTFAEAAAMPLTSITAWELLFDRLGVPRDGDAEGAGTLLVVGGAGGVGSILIQLASRLTRLHVVATASRPETREWCLALGAHAVIDHSEPLDQELERINRPQVEYVAGLTETDRHFPAYVAAIAPQGRIGLIDDPAQPIDVRLLKRKSASLHWELMFTRSLFETPDMIAQHRLLTEVAGLVDRGVIRTTLAETIGVINSANLKRAHALLESGKSKGKVVLEGF